MALSVVQKITFVAGLACSRGYVELLAIFLNLAADSLLVKVEVVGAFGTDSISPCLASKIIINDPEEVGVLELGTVLHFLEADLALDRRVLGDGT